MSQDMQILGSSSGSDFFAEKKCDIFLRIYFKTSPAEEIKIVGNIPELGSWDTNHGLSLSTDSEMYPYWLNKTSLKVAKNTNLEFKIVIFSNGYFKQWEQLPNNGNRYHYIKFSKVCLEMREFNADIKERIVAKFDSDSDIKFSDNTIWRKIGIGKKMCPYELAKESDSENSSDKISDLIGDMISPNNFDSSSFMSASKSESQSDFDNDSDFNENNSNIRSNQNKRMNKMNTSILPITEKEKKRENLFKEIYDKYIKNMFKSSKKKMSQNNIKSIPSFFTHLTKKPKKIPKISDEILIIFSFFPPIKIKKVKISNNHTPSHSPDSHQNFKWRTKPIMDSFYTDFYNYLLRKSHNFYWFCWPGFNVMPNEQKELTKYLQENYRIVPIFFDSMKMQIFIESLCFKRLKPACNNLIDVFSSDLEFEDIDFQTYNEINKAFAKGSLKFLNSHNINMETSFLVLNYHLFRVPFYLRKTIVKTKKNNRPSFHNISLFFINGFPNPENIRFLGNFQKLLISLMFCDLMIFSIFEHVRNFLLNCEQYLQITHKTHEGGRLYLEFDGRIIFINIIHPYLEFPRKDYHHNLDYCESKNPLDLENLSQKYQDFIIIVSLDQIDNFSMIEMKFLAFQLFVKSQTSKKIVLIQLLYNVFESCYVRNIEYLEKLSQIADNINKSFNDNNSIEVVYCNKCNREGLSNFLKKTSIFLKLSLIRDENYMYHLEYLSLKNDAIIILSTNLFQSKAFKSIISINSLNMTSIQQALLKALPLIGTKTQECRVIFDREYLRKNNIDNWFLYNSNSLLNFSYYYQKEFKLVMDNIKYEGDIYRLVLPNPNFEEIEIKTIANSYKKAENRVIILDFEGVFLDITNVNDMLNTNNILEIESKINKCKPLSITNDETLSKFKSIVRDPKNSVYMISSLSHDKMAFFLSGVKDLTLFSENGYICQKIGRDEVPLVNYYEKADTSWKAIVQTVILEYVAKTEGSYLIEKKYSLIWIFDKVEKDFAAIQTKELLEHLNEVLEFIDVIEIVKYETLIEVRLKNCHKGMGSIIGVYETYMLKGPVDFFLCIGGTKEFSSDLFSANKALLRSKDEIFDDNLAFFNCAIDAKNCNTNADGYLKEIGEFHKLISLLGAEEDVEKNLQKKHLTRGGAGGIFKQIAFDEE